MGALPANRSLVILAVSLVVGMNLPNAEASASHGNALWRVVHGLCMRNMRLTGSPAPCLAVDAAAGVAVVPDPNPRRRTQVLLTPTARLEGIESPELLRAGGPNYWQAAWDARRYFEARAGRSVPRDVIALAINSSVSRSQNQLHIHVDCIRADVRAALKAHEGEINHAWTPLAFPLAGRIYKARSLDGAELGQRNPFEILARGDPVARAHMGLFTLVVVGVVGADGAPGFVLLSDQVDVKARHPAFGEELQDHRCAVLRGP